MASIREVVRALAAREGVDAVIVLGRDGLPIDASTADGLDADSLAALVPPVISACGRLGAAASRGDFSLGAIEYGSGKVVLVNLTPDALLAVFVRANHNIGSLLFDLSRHRKAIAALL
jgi:predicted regulator of Ras-like GTPase activity (Roadblock/LC7/MglB family)